MVMAVAPTAFVCVSPDPPRRVSTRATAKSAGQRTEDGRLGRLQSGHSPVVGGPNRAARISVVSGRCVWRQCRFLDFQTRPDVPGRPATDQQMRMYMKLRCHHPQHAAAAKAGFSERTGRRIEGDRGCRPRRVLSDPCGGRSPTRSAACGRATSCRYWSPVPACGR